MSDVPTIMQIIERLRRAQPRNADTMAVCDELEQQLQRPMPAVTAASCGKFDRVAYQKAYMKIWRKRRAQAVALSS
jgi:hypothetical protein